MKHNNGFKDTMKNLFEIIIFIGIKYKSLLTLHSDSALYSYHLKHKIYVDIKIFILQGLYKIIYWMHGK